MKLKSFKPESLQEGYDDDMAWEAREKYKINRVKEILLFHWDNFLKQSVIDLLQFSSMLR